MRHHVPIPPRARAARAAVPAAVLAWVAMPVPAWAHGIGADASDQSVLAFVPIGIEHMLLGWDHLLFIAGVVLLAWKIGRAAKLISLFVLGHSTTLIIATMAGWRINPLAIDAVIGFSVFFVGVVGLYGRPKSWRWFGAAVLAFGLLHGLGLSTRLQDLGLPEDGLLGRVIAFNVGIEIGQLCVIAVLVGLSRLAVTLVRRPRFQQSIFAALSLIGMGAAAIFAGQAAVDLMEDEATAVTSGTNSCVTGDRTFRFTLGGGGHSPKPFYEPGEPIPNTDFGHVIGDGYVVVTYAPPLPAAELQGLRTYVTEPHKVVGGSLPEQAEPVRAYHAYAQLTCQRFDLEALRSFVDGWFADPRSRAAE